MIIYENHLINETQENEYNNIKNIIKTGNLYQIEKIEKNYLYNLKIQSALVKRYILEEMYSKAISICKRFENCDVIQSQLITIYLKQSRYEDAISICKKFPNNEHIQSQLIFIYSKSNLHEEALTLCSKFLQNDIIRSQFLKIMSYREVLENKKLQEKFNPYLKEIETLNTNSYYLNMFSINESSTKSNLIKIRTKLSNGTIEQNDILLLEGLESKIDINTYKFILVAIYHRLNLTKTALQVLKTIDQSYNKYKIAIYNALTSNKNTFYNLGLYDEIIDWKILDYNKEQIQKNYKKNRY